MKPYPLRDQASGELKAASGRPLSEIQLDESLSIDDLNIQAGTLQMQAEIAQEAGYAQLAANLVRASELAAVPNDLMLQIYAMLRPRRASFENLMEIAALLAKEYEAHENARFIREAAEVYRQRGLLRPD